MGWDAARALNVMGRQMDAVFVVEISACPPTRTATRNAASIQTAPVLATIVFTVTPT